MIVSDVDEAAGILGRMLTALLGTLHNETGREGAALRYAVGDLLANAAFSIQSSQLSGALLNGFTLAFQAGARLPDMDAVRLTMLAERPSSLQAIAVTSLGIRFALCQEARIVSATTFVSRDDVTAAISQMNDAFDPAEEFAADNADPSVYQALVSLHAAVTHDLSERARPLPRMTAYSFARSFPSLRLANRLYADGSRADELRAEGKVIHPAFMPASGRALSA